MSSVNLNYWNFKADFRVKKQRKIMMVINDLSSLRTLRKVFHKKFLRQFFMGGKGKRKNIKIFSRNSKTWFLDLQMTHPFVLQFINTKLGQNAQSRRWKYSSLSHRLSSDFFLQFIFTFHKQKLRHWRR